MKDLKEAWTGLKEAEATMVRGPAPGWPWSENQDVYLAQLARRDRVQGLGGAFNDHWRRSAPAIRQAVNDHPEIFPELNVETKGELPDPTGYQQAGLIMPRLIQHGL